MWDALENVIAGFCMKIETIFIANLSGFYKHAFINKIRKSICLFIDRLNKMGLKHRIKKKQPKFEL